MPTSKEKFFKAKSLKWLKSYSKPLERSVENMASNFPGFFYGKIKVIVSEKINMDF